MTFRGLLTHRVRIERRTETIVAGRTSLSWQVRLRDVPCQLEITAATPVRDEAGDSLLARARGWFLPESGPQPRSDLVAGERVIVLSPANWAGRVFLVESVVDAAGRGHHLEAVLNEQPGQQ